MPAEPRAPAPAAAPVPARPSAHGAPVLRAQLRASPADFRVDELDAFAPDGQGEHLLLTVEKRGMNTAYAAQRLADWAGIDVRGIGYAGMKDRHALTVQRFSVHLPRKVAPDIATLDTDDLRVLAHAWHGRKLPRGALAGNRFTLTLRDVEGTREAIETRLSAIAARGVPNYFGEQRFGHGGDNLDAARSMFAGRRVGREKRGLLLSAARSALFNAVLGVRVQDRTWDTGLDGEVWMLDGSRSVFGPVPFDDALAARLAAFDIHPTGPLWGRGALRTGGAAQALEQAVHEWPGLHTLADGLEHAGLSQERRALRLRPGDMAWRWLDDGALELAFVLPAGSYATVVVEALGAVTNAASREA